MNIDLGYLGKAVLEEMEPYPVFADPGGYICFTVVLNGYTHCGIRVHGVVDDREFAEDYYPMVWNNAILIKV